MPEHSNRFKRNDAFLTSMYLTRTATGSQFLLVKYIIKIKGKTS